MSADLDIAQLLTSLGYGTPESQQRARAHLENEGLTNAKKSRISAEKLDRVKASLSAKFAVVCTNPACAQAVARGREIVHAIPQTACEHCGGSDNRKAFLRLEAAARRRGVSKLVIIGGSPSVREELREQSPGSWQLRLIDGTERRTARDAQADLDWADVVLVWGASELDHKVSKLYTDAPPPTRRKIVQIARRGIAALLNAASEHLEK